jgi:hypothetical protein
MNRLMGGGRGCFGLEFGMNQSRGHVSLHVEGEVVRTGEGPVTEATVEWSISRVLPVVPRQLVWPCELPAATLPIALVRLLSCKSMKKQNVVIFFGLKKVMLAFAYSIGPRAWYPASKFTTAVYTWEFNSSYKAIKKVSQFITKYVPEVGLEPMPIFSI